MWTKGSVEGLTVKIVAQNTVDHRVNVVLTSSCDMALTDNNNDTSNESAGRHLLTGVFGCPQFLLPGDLQAYITVNGVKVYGNYWRHLL
jgi:hypothetical protein